MIKRITLYLLFILCVQTSFGQYDQKAMYNCYLGDGKSLWRQYITTANWSAMNNNERERLLNYEYGYIAYAISVKDKDAKRMLTNFETHISQMEGKMSESTRLTYLSAAASYNLTMNKLNLLTLGPKVISYADKAVKTDGTNPYALLLRGSIYFYCPGTFGGDKNKALSFLQKAERQFEQTGDTVYNWNYRSAQMIIAQCYEKLGEKQKAIAKCRAILRSEPDFLYIRDIYLPELLGTRKRDNATQDVGSSMVNILTN